MTQNYDTKLEWVTDQIKQSNIILPQNKELFLKFRSDLEIGKVTRQLSVGRIYKYAWMVHIFLRSVQKPIVQCTN